MTEIASPAQALAAFDLWFCRDREVIQFAIDYLRERPEMRERGLLGKIAALNQKLESDVEQAGALLRQHVLAQDADYTVQKYASEQFAKALFKRKLEQYLAKQCTPWAICNMTSSVEHAYDPLWLGQMWNACDWVNPEHTHETFSHLRWEVEETLRKLTE